MASTDTSAVSSPRRRRPTPAPRAPGVTVSSSTRWASASSTCTGVDVHRQLDRRRGVRPGGQGAGDGVGRALAVQVPGRRPPPRRWAWCPRWRWWRRPARGRPARRTSRSGRTSAVVARAVTTGSTSRSAKKGDQPGPGVQRLVVGGVDGRVDVQADPGAWRGTGRPRRRRRRPCGRRPPAAPGRSRACRGRGGGEAADVDAGHDGRARDVAGGDQQVDAVERRPGRRARRPARGRRGAATTGRGRRRRRLVAGRRPVGVSCPRRRPRRTDRRRGPRRWGRPSRGGSGGADRSKAWVLSSSAAGRRPGTAVAAGAAVASARAPLVRPRAPTGAPSSQSRVTGRVSSNRVLLRPGCRPGGTAEGRAADGRPGRRARMRTVSSCAGGCWGMGVSSGVPWTGGPRERRSRRPSLRTRRRGGRGGVVR